MIFLHPALIDGRVYLAPLLPPVVVVTPPDDGVSTVKVTILAVDQQGNRMAGAMITAILNKVDVDPVFGYVAPEPIEIIADEDGMADLYLWPNVLGSQGSKYIFTIENPDTEQVMRIDTVIPNEDCILHEIAVPVT